MKTLNEMRFSIDALDRQVRTLASAATPSEVFKSLLDGARLAAPRAAIFLVRQGLVKGWGCVGYGREVAAGQRRFSVPADSGWFGDLIRSPHTEPGSPGEPGEVPDFGQPFASESVAIPVRVKDRAIALLLGQRSDGESPWFPAALSLLVRVAQLRLDLDVARRRLETTAGDAGTPTPAPRKPAEPSVSTPPVSGEPATVRDEADEARLQAARRFAKLVATDIRLYNEEAVMLGRRNGDLAERLVEHLGRGKETFLRRHGELGPTALEILHEAYVQVLAGGDGNLMPASVLE